MVEEANVDISPDKATIPNSIESSNVLAQQNPNVINAMADGGSGSTDLRTLESTSEKDSRSNSNNVPLPLPASSGIRKSQDSMHKNRASITKKAQQKAAVEKANQEESKGASMKESFGGLEKGRTQEDLPMESISMKN